eukprot:CAMPEP_0170516696 /NCGR_PEP_ID=MMETSP0209-20121228/2848_1 /TAXON_ID=665100 ORGANISM="Litonotus pictus, Strain P1" /NCGR_SAMPLE_ID=MMETSP0209 /ASSEMBLY_ACC=CAM_ASM_000301 /LENGTH=667 /DNA_ID=CAMNT_0010801679 /DNA_START=883 /DNA_END=2883 /DNA_ORIENTATION=+
MNINNLNQNLLNQNLYHPFYQQQTYQNVNTMKASSFSQPMGFVQNKNQHNSNYTNTSFNPMLTNYNNSGASMGSYSIMNSNMYNQGNIPWYMMQQQAIQNTNSLEISNQAMMSNKQGRYDDSKLSSALVVSVNLTSRKSSGISKNEPQSQDPITISHEKKPRKETKDELSSNASNQATIGGKRKKGNEHKKDYFDSSQALRVIKEKPTSSKDSFKIQSNEIKSFSNKRKHSEKEEKFYFCKDGEINAKFLEQTEDLTSLVQEQNPSREIQKLIESHPHIVESILIPKIKRDFLPLTSHKFGNYLIQNMLQYMSFKSIDYLYQSLKGQVYELSTSLYGTKIIQKIIDYLSVHQKEELCIILLPKKALDMINHLNGYHVILKLFSFLLQRSKDQAESLNTKISFDLSSATNKDSQSLFKELSSKIPSYAKLLDRHKKDPLHIDCLFNLIFVNLNNICMDENGCCFIQRILDITYEEAFGKVLILKILENFSDLSKHTYGNYIIQKIVMDTNAKHSYNNFIYSSLSKDFIAFGTNKSSSKIIERLIQHYSNTHQQEEIISEILSMENIVRSLILSKYGNFVFQSILKYSSKDQRSLILKEAGKILEDILCCTFGTQMVSNLLETYPEFSSYSDVKLLEKYSLSQNTLKSSTDFSPKQPSTKGRKKKHRSS